MHKLDLCDHVIDGSFELMLPVFDISKPRSDVFRRVRLSFVGQRFRFRDRLLARVLHAVAVITVREALWTGSCENNESMKSVKVLACSSVQRATNHRVTADR